MSRVRILNLPRDCTEEQLKCHLLTSLPPSAPHMEVTDCVIKRLQSSRNGKSVIRMAFVGFRNASSGHFVVRHFDGTYFRSAKLRVESAKGLGEVGVTTNMRKKMEELQQKRESTMTTGVGREIKDDNSKQKEGSSSNLKRGRNEDAQEATGRKHKEEIDREMQDAQLLKKKERKEEFIEGRTKATSGPTWAAEVLLPGSAGVNRTISDDDLNDHKNRNDSDNNFDDGDEEEAERRALERQQALGKVSDLEFLASLANKTEKTSSNSAIKGIEKGGVADDATHRHDEDEDEEKKDDGTSGQQRQQANPSFESDSQEAIVCESRRVRLGNIPFIATEDDVKQFASSLIGPVEAVHIPLTKDTRQSKGAAFVKFVQVADAVRALSLCNGAVFMGRLLRVSAAVEDPYTKKVESAANGAGLAGSSEFKRQREQERRKEGNSTIVWNTMYMNSHAAVESVAKRLGVTSDAVVSVNARGAAVRAAIAEAYLTTEIQQVLSDEGIDFGLLDNAQQNLLKTRSNTTILVKNIQTTTPEDAAQLSKMFLRYGALEATAFPSAGGFALFRYTHQQDARLAFQRLSYKLFKNAPLFLEWAPIGAIVNKDDGDDNDDVEEKKKNKTTDNNTHNEEKDDDDLQGGNAAFAPVLTLFITNIPFASKEEDFYTFLLDTCPRLAKAPEKHVERLAFEQDKGRAFLTLKEQSTFTYVQHRLNGKSFAGRTLACVPSKQTAMALKMNVPPFSSTPRTKEEEEDDVTKTSAVIANHGAASRPGSHVPPGYDALKLVVKNVPFEATERDIRELFSAFSEISSVRLPRKSHQFSSHRENNHRGFAFVEFLSEEEAKRAMETLKATHLYGRHLVLQYAKLDEQ